MSSSGYTSIQQITGISGAVSKMILINSVTQQMLKVLFNPNKLTIELAAIVGSLSPIGSGHPIQHYSHTEAVKFDLELYWSAVWAKQLGVETSLNKIAGWINSFLCPIMQHRAPAPLLVVWPNTLTMLVVVRGVKTSYDHWFARSTTEIVGPPRTGTFVLTCTEKREAMRSASRMREYGYASSDEGHSLAGVAKGTLLGQRGKGPNLG